MNKRVDDTLVPVPVGLLAQIKAMSSFLKYQTMSFEEIWDDIDKRCEEVAKDLSGYVNVVGIAHALFEIEKSEGPEGAQDLIDEIITGMSSEEVNGFMALVARELRRLSKKYKEGKE